MTYSMMSVMVFFSVTAINLFAESDSLSEDAAVDDQITQEVKKALASHDVTGKIDSLKKVVEKYPTNPIAYSWLFYIYEAQSFEAESNGATNQAISLLNDARKVVDDYFKAINASKKTSGLKQEESDHFFKKMLEDSNRREKMIKDLEQQLEIFREGNRLKASNKYSEAIKQYDLALSRIDNRFFHWIYFNRGVAYQKLGELDKALSDLNQAIEHYNVDPNFYSQREHIYLKRKDFSKAMADYNKAILLDDQWAIAYLGRAKAYEALGEMESASKDMERARELGVFEQDKSFQEEK